MILDPTGPWMMLSLLEDDIYRVEDHENTSLKTLLMEMGVMKMVQK